MKKKRNIKLTLPLMGIAAMLLALFAIPSTAEAQGKSEVYVNSNNATGHSGDGTITNPYNLFNDAVEGVSDGGTIYVLEKGAMINDLGSNDAPFVIGKQISVKPAPGISDATLNSRAGGIILGKDVTFENIALNVTNNNHSQIFANGHHLTLKNVTYVANTRLVDLVAGGLYSADQSVIGTAPGNHGQITVEGKSCQFGDIYAGSINGRFDGSTTITLQDTSTTSIDKIFACGAEDSSTLSPDAARYPVSEKVSITLNNAPIRTIDGAGAYRTEVSLHTENLVSSCSYTNINKITVTSGTFQPSTLSAPSNRKLSAVVSTNGTLDLTSIGDLTLENFSGGGALILGQSSLLTITGEVTGTTSFFSVRKNSDGTSGVVTENHVYIKTAPTSSDSFTFKPTPSPAQKNLKLEMQSNGDWKIVKPSSGQLVTFTYASNDSSMGYVEYEDEIIDPIYDEPFGSEAIPWDGYHFVKWTKDGITVSTESCFIPQKSGNTYTGGNYIAHFAEGDAPDTPDPGNPDPDNPDPGNPDPSDPDPGNPDSGNPDPGNPDPGNPGPENPDPSDPDPENPDLPGSGDTDPGDSNPVTPTPPVSPKPTAPAVTAPHPVKVSLSTPKVTLKSGKKYAVIKYKKVKNAHGYEIYRSTKKKSGYKKITNTKKTSYKNKKLKSKKKYYYKVRAYRTVNGKKYYSSYSAIKSVKVK